MLWTEGIILGIALLGAVLGVVNTWHLLSKDRVRLRVTPVQSLHVMGGEVSDWTLGIEVVNLSAFPVTISDVGFLRGRYKGKRVVIIHPILFDRMPWPRRLQPHDSVTVYTEDLEHEPEMVVVKRAYACTTSGIVRYGKSGALRQFVQRLRERH